MHTAVSMAHSCEPTTRLNRIAAGAGDAVWTIHPNVGWCAVASARLEHLPTLVASTEKHHLMAFERCQRCAIWAVECRTRRLTHRRYSDLRGGHGRSVLATTGQVAYGRKAISTELLATLRACNKLIEHIDVVPSARLAPRPGRAGWGCQRLQSRFSVPTPTVRDSPV